MLLTRWKKKITKCVGKLEASNGDIGFKLYEIASNDNDNDKYQLPALPDGARCYSGTIRASCSFCSLRTEYLLDEEIKIIKLALL